jgi:hypothetical protein
MFVASKERPMSIKAMLVKLYSLEVRLEWLAPFCWQAKPVFT